MSYEVASTLGAGQPQSRLYPQSSPRARPVSLTVDCAPNAPGKALEKTGTAAANRPSHGLLRSEAERVATPTRGLLSKRALHALYSGPERRLPWLRPLGRRMDPTPLVFRVQPVVPNDREAPRGVGGHVLAVVGSLPSLA